MNERLKKIRDYQRKAGARREAGVFVAEGLKQARELPKERLVSLVISEGFFRDHPAESEELKEMAGEAKATFDLVSDNDFSRLSDTKSPQGVLAVLRTFDYTPEEILGTEDGLFLLLENLQDPGNVGTILRAGEAAGVSGVILSAGGADPYNPKVVRAAMGSLFRMKFAVTGDLSKVVREIQKRGGKVYAAHLKESVSYDRNDYTGAAAFLIGNESKGLSEALTEAADSAVKIPMEGEVESLNAAMAATILMFEASRQRRAKKGL